MARTPKNERLATMLLLLGGESAIQYRYLKGHHLPLLVNSAAGKKLTFVAGKLMAWRDTTHSETRYKQQGIFERHIL